MGHHRAVKFESGTKVGPYEILGELGQGGMATVYRAYQPSLEREVALKILPDFLLQEPGFKARFHREAVAVARLQHPNILSVFDHGEYEGVVYIVSEYVEGGTLAARLGAPIQLDYSVRILRPIADALDYAHAEGIIHRDVKPSNILLDRRGVPILSDFGLARIEEARESGRLTQTGATVGTPTYMAPEQCAGLEAHEAADIYALAVIAYEMVTGRVPFSAPTPLGVMSAHQLKAPPPPRKINPSLPAVVEEPLLAGLAKEPGDRPATATDFVEALAAAVSSGSINVPMTPAPIYPLSPPPPSQVPAAMSPPPPSQIPTAAPSPPPPSLAWQAAPPAPPPMPVATPPLPSPPPPTVPPPLTAPLSPPYGSVPTPMSPSPPQTAYPPQASPYMPPTAYAPQAAWGMAPPPARSMPSWVLIVLAVNAAISALGVLFAIIVNITGSDLSTSTRVTWLLLGILFAIASALSIGALLGLIGRDGWAPVAGWASVGTLALTIVGIPFAAAAGWGLVSASKAQAGAQPKPGGPMRAVGTALVMVVMLVITGTASTWGWTHPVLTSSVTPAHSPSPSVCAMAQPGSQITASAAGGVCGFAVSTTLVELDCRRVTAPPSALNAISWDYNKKAEGGTATLAMDNGGCHFAAPSYFVASELVSDVNLAPGDTVMVADLVPVEGKVGMRFLYGCDGTGCTIAELYLPDNTVDVFEDGKDLISHDVTVHTGANRLMLAVQKLQIRVWFNGTLITTQTQTRTHAAGLYGLSLISLDKTGPVRMDSLQFAVYRVT